MCPPTGDSRFSALCRTRICLPLRLHIPHPIRRTAQTDAKHPIHRTGGSKGSGGIAAKQAAAESGAVIVPAFDDARTIAGQGTVAKETVEQLGREPDRIILPVGGGDLG